MPYVDTVILRYAWNRDTCNRLFGERECQRLIPREYYRFYDERAEKEIIDFLNKNEPLVINKRILLKDLPPINDLSGSSIAGATGIITKVKNVVLGSLDEETAFKKGKEILSEGCKAMSESILNREQKVHYDIFCEGSELKPINRIVEGLREIRMKRASIDGLKRDIAHLGSAFYLDKRKEFVTIDKDFLGFKPFVKKVKIRRPSDY